MRRAADRRNDRREAARFRHDPNSDQPVAAGVIEFGLRVLVDLVRRFGRRDFDHERVDVLIGERLLGDFAWLAVFDQRDRLVRQQIQLIGALAQHHIEKRIEPCRHASILRARVQHVRAVDQVDSIARRDGEERLGHGIQIVEHPRVVLGQLQRRPAEQLRAIR